MRKSFIVGNLFYDKSSSKQKDNIVELEEPVRQKRIILTFVCIDIFSSEGDFESSK